MVSAREKDIPTFPEIFVFDIFQTSIAQTECKHTANTWIQVSECQIEIIRPLENDRSSAEIHVNLVKKMFGNVCYVHSVSMHKIYTNRYSSWNVPKKNLSKSNLSNCCNPLHTTLVSEEKKIYIYLYKYIYIPYIYLAISAGDLIGMVKT